MLGLPGDLLPETPKDIFDMVLAGAGTLREGYDDATNGELVRATMKAYLPNDRSLRSKVMNAVERSVSKVFFKHGFPLPDWKAKQMGVVPNPFDYARFAVFQAYAIPMMLGHIAAERIPVVNEIADVFLVRRINELLVSYGHAEFTTDPAKHGAIPKGAGGHASHGGTIHQRPAAATA
ncbi:MAG: hypothetical protein H0U59_03950 [Gemmatimonadaceae bacterium]|nr:hypothetical protein [Gemmatimonadaceae bacterium]